MNSEIELDKLIDIIKDKKLQMDDTSIPSISNNAQELMCEHFCKYRENLSEELLDELCYNCPMGWLN